MRAVVLAAGLGTRLRPLTDVLPKALCPVGNRALVDWALERVAAVADDIAVNVHAGRAQMEQHLRGCGVHVSIEADEALGTAGALGLLREWIDGRPVLVTNADAFHGFDVGVLVDGWEGVQPRLLVVEDRERPDFDGRWRYVGSSLLAWRHVAGLEPVPSGLYEALWSKVDVELVPVEGAFFDCGTPSDYLAANLHASGGHSVVGAGAVVEGELVRSVVWPGGVVRADERLVESIRVGADLTVEAPLRLNR
ncbi:MAG TPA: sugar phosphate nucleotidyltransferase [Mycobacteriales bacterium]|nr:sugar phosphate nucleotidyltransferase [Mycobacteriales bacterium]